MKSYGIRSIPIEIARPFIETWHYSGKCPTGRNIFFGWFVTDRSVDSQTNLFGETLYAVANYGDGINPNQGGYLTKATGLNVTNERLLELRRLCRVEPKIERYPLTRFLSVCHRLLKALGYYYVVSFSDPEYGHNGGIYKAANFEYLGKTESVPHAVDQNGEKRHRRYYYRYAKRNGIGVKEAREKLGLTKVKTTPKDRWFIVINRKEAKSEQSI